MTKKQIDAMASALIEQAGMHVKTAQEHTSAHAEATWIAHMTASMVCSDLVEALLAARRNANGSE